MWHLHLPAGSSKKRQGRRLTDWLFSDSGCLLNAPQPGPFQRLAQGARAGRGSGKGTAGAGCLPSPDPPVPQRIARHGGVARPGGTGMRPARAAPRRVCRVCRVCWAARPSPGTGRNAPASFWSAPGQPAHRGEVRGSAGMVGWGGGSRRPGVCVVGAAWPGLRGRGLHGQGCCPARGLCGWGLRGRGCVARVCVAGVCVAGFCVAGAAAQPGGRAGERCFPVPAGCRRAGVASQKPGFISR